jgi:hypothetical protein
VLVFLGLLLNVLFGLSNTRSLVGLNHDFLYWNEISLKIDLFLIELVLVISSL